MLKCGQTCCVEKPVIDYTVSVVKDIIVCGSIGPEIRRDILELEDLDTKSTIDLVGLIEGKETSRKAWVAGNLSDVSAASSYKRTHKEDQIEVKLSLKTKWSICDVKISQYACIRFARMNKVPFTKCAKCHKDSQPKQLNSDLQSQALKSEQFKDF